MTVKDFCHQGDVGLEKISAVPDGAQQLKQAGEIVVASGRSNSNRHVLKGDGIKVYNKGAFTYFVVPNKAILEHPEHVPPITLPEGIYFNRKQFEYSAREIRQIMD